MSIERIIELLESLQEDVNLWDREDEEIAKLADDTIEALKLAIDIINSSQTVGTLIIGDKKYVVSQ